jgi:hypothetical protein
VCFLHFLEATSSLVTTTLVATTSPGGTYEKLSQTESKSIFHVDEQKALQEENGLYQSPHEQKMMGNIEDNAMSRYCFIRITAFISIT